jgi:CheB methylesterase
MDEPPGQPGVPRLIGIVSSSTGGCEALREILGNLPPDFPVPILVFPSINPRNFEWLATGLNAKSRFQVTMAEDDQVPQPGTGTAKFAIQLNTACVSLPVQEIAPKLVALVASGPLG